MTFLWLALNRLFGVGLYAITEGLSSWPSFGFWLNLSGEKELTKAGMTDLFFCRWRSEGSKSRSSAKSFSLSVLRLS